MGGSNSRERDKQMMEVVRRQKEGNKDGARDSAEASFSFLFFVCLDVMLEPQSHFMVESFYIFTELLQLKKKKWTESYFEQQ